MTYLEIILNVFVVVCCGITVFLFTKSRSRGDHLFCEKKKNPVRKKSQRKRAAVPDNDDSGFDPHGEVYRLLRRGFASRNSAKHGFTR